MNKLLLVLLGGLLATGLADAAANASSATKARANDYPTIERVEYVLDCARDARGAPQENIYKCTCVIDAIAQRLSYDQYVEYSTAAKAFSIGGERGEVMRGYTSGKELAGRYRTAQADARKACFVR